MNYLTNLFKKIGRFFRSVFINISLTFYGIESKVTKNLNTENKSEGNTLTQKKETSTFLDQLYRGEVNEKYNNYFYNILDKAEELHLARYGITFNPNDYKHMVKYQEGDFYSNESLNFEYTGVDLTSKHKKILESISYFSGMLEEYVELWIKTSDSVTGEETNRKYLEEFKLIETISTKRNRITRVDTLVSFNTMYEIKGYFVLKFNSKKEL